MKGPSKVLLIDDDQDDGYFLSIALSHLPYAVEFHHDQDSETALIKLLNNTNTVPDILFLDWNMPKINGKQCLLRLRKMPAFANLPIVIFTTSNHPALIEESHRLGASYFLPKPATLKELVEKITNIFSLEWK